MSGGAASAEVATPMLTDQEIAETIAAVGAWERGDGNFDPADHAKRLADQDKASTLIAVLSVPLAGARDITSYAAPYERQSAMARRHKRIFELSVFLLAVPLIASLLALYFLALVPQEDGNIPRELLPPVRWALALVVGVGVAGLAGALERFWGVGKSIRDGLIASAERHFKLLRALSKSLLRGDNSDRARYLLGQALELVCLAGLIGAVTIAAYPYVPDRATTGFLSGLHLATRAVPVVWLCLILLFWGGLRPGNAIRLLRRRQLAGANPLAARWYTARGNAEALRRKVYPEVLDRMASLDLAAKERCTALLLALEYFRRFQIEVQTDYYKERSEASAREAARNDLLRGLAFVVLAVAAGFRLVLAWASATEQGGWTGGIAALDDAAAWLIGLSMSGADDATSIFALLMLAVYLSLQIRYWVLGEHRTRKRATSTLVELRDYASNEPGRANFELKPTPLLEARRAAARGDRAAVARFIGSVNGIFAAEVNEWDPDVPFSIWTEDGLKHLRSMERLTHPHFERIVRELCENDVVASRYKRRGRIRAMREPRGRLIETRSEGKESHVWAKRGDWIVSNLSSDGTAIFDSQGYANRYVIQKQLFEYLYKPVPNTRRLFDPTERNSASAVNVSGSVDIVAPWGERQRVDECILVCKTYDGFRPDEVYGVAKRHFRSSYGDPPPDTV